MTAACDVRAMHLARESGRKLLHVAVSLAAVMVLWLTSDAAARVIFSIVAAVAVIIDAARLLLPSARRRFNESFAFMLREHEHHALTGATTLALGTALAVVLFPEPAATAGLLYAGVADAAAAIVGRSFGRHVLIAGKTVEGSVAFLIMALLLGWALPTLSLPAAALAAGLVTPIEAAPLPIDDNFLLPVVGAAAAAAAAMLLA